MIHPQEALLQQGRALQPEALALIAMMTAPFMLGLVLLATLVTAGLETVVRRLRPARA